MSSVFPVRLLLIVGFALAAHHAAAVPGHIYVQGQLLDENGTPIVYYGENEQRLPSILLPSRIQFYSDEATTETILLAREQDVFINIDTGSSFSIPVDLPNELLAEDELWYDLAIDTNQDGLDDADLFADRFEFASVPFALSAQPVFYFDTHGGYSSTSAGTPVNFFLVPGGAPVDDRVALAPFTTPAGGVTFDRVSFFVEQLDPGCNFSVGIYDMEGNAVFRSPVMNTTNTIIGFYVGLDTTETSLQPSTVYFTAIAATNPMMIRNVIVPSMPMTGTYFITPDGGNLPEDIDIAAIDGSKIVIPISLNLTNTAEMPGGERNKRPAFDFISTDPNWKGGNPLRIVEPHHN